MNAPDSRTPHSIPEESKLPKRPFSATILIPAVLIFTSLNILRTIAVIRSWSFLGSLPMRIPVIYIAIAGFVWSSFGIIIFICLLLKKRWAPPLSMILFIGFLIHYWLDRLLIAKIAQNDHQWQFALVLTLLTLVIEIWIVINPENRNYFNA